MGKLSSCDEDAAVTMWPRAAIPYLELTDIPALLLEGITRTLWFLDWATGQVSLVSVAFVVLFCISVINCDIAYLLVRLAVPPSEVWSETSQRQWAFAWMVTWLVQIPFWRQVLPPRSPLL